MRGGDPAVCSHRVEAVHSILSPDKRAAEIQKFALIGSRCSLHSEAWLVRGVFFAVSHRVELFTAFHRLVH